MSLPSRRSPTATTVLLAALAILPLQACRSREAPPGPHRIVRVGPEEYLAAGGEGHVADLGVASAYDHRYWIFWTRLLPGMTGSTIHARFVGADGDAARATLVVDTTRADLRRGEITGCAWPGERLRVAWTGTAPAREPPSPQAVLDVLDVFARDMDAASTDGKAAGTFVVNDVTRGWQYEAALWCDRDPRGIVAWHSHCYNAGPPHRASRGFARPSCSNDMPPTIALRELAWQGGDPSPPATVTRMEADSRWLPRIGFASGDTLVVVRVPGGGGTDGIRVDVLDFNGDRRAGVSIVAKPNSRPELACDRHERCLLVWLEGSEVVAAAFSTRSTRPYVRVTFERYAESEQPVDPNVACDRDGVCLVVWAQQHVEFSGAAAGIVPVGVIGRIYDLRNAALGTSEQISRTGLDLLETPRAVAVADGEFLVAWPGDREHQGIFSQRLQAAAER